MPARDPLNTDLTGVARDAETITEVLASLEASGYRSQFMAAAGKGQADEIVCAACRRQYPAEHAHTHRLHRLEGASDPDDMLAIAALECPLCAARGTLVLNYGPGATREDAVILQSLERHDTSASERP